MKRKKKRKIRTRNPARERATSCETPLMRSHETLCPVSLLPLVCDKTAVHDMTWVRGINKPNESETRFKPSVYVMSRRKRQAEGIAVSFASAVPKRLPTTDRAQHKELIRSCVAIHDDDVLPESARRFRLWVRGGLGLFGGG